MRYRILCIFFMGINAAAFSEESVKRNRSAISWVTYEQSQFLSDMITIPHIYCGPSSPFQVPKDQFFKVDVKASLTDSERIPSDTFLESIFSPDSFEKTVEKAIAPLCDESKPELYINLSGHGSPGSMGCQEPYRGIKYSVFVKILFQKMKSFREKCHKDIELNIFVLSCFSGSLIEYAKNEAQNIKGSYWNGTGEENYEFPINIIASVSEDSLDRSDGSDYDFSLDENIFEQLYVVSWLNKRQSPEQPCFSEDDYDSFCTLGEDVSSRMNEWHPIWSSYRHFPQEKDGESSPKRLPYFMKRLENIENNPKARDLQRIYIKKIGKMKEKAEPAIPLLIKILQRMSSYEYFSETVAETLALIGKPAIQSLLYIAENTSDKKIKYYALKALREMEPTDQIRSVFKKALTDDDPKIQDMAIDSISKLKFSGDEIAEELNQLLKQRKPVTVPLLSLFEHSPKASTLAKEKLIEIANNYKGRNEAPIALWALKRIQLSDKERKSLWKNYIDHHDLLVGGSIVVEILASDETSFEEVIRKASEPGSNHIVYYLSQADVPDPGKKEKIDSLVTDTIIRELQNPTEFRSYILDALRFRVMGLSEIHKQKIKQALKESKAPLQQSFMKFFEEPKTEFDTSQASVSDLIQKISPVESKFNWSRGGRALVFSAFTELARRGEKAKEAYPTMVKILQTILENPYQSRAYPAKGEVLLAITKMNPNAEELLDTIRTGMLLDRPKDMSKEDFKNYMNAFQEEEKNNVKKAAEALIIIGKQKDTEKTDRAVLTLGALFDFCEKRKKDGIYSYQAINSQVDLTNAISELSENGSELAKSYLWSYLSYPHPSIALAAAAGLVKSGSLSKEEMTILYKTRNSFKNPIFLQRMDSILNKKP